MEQENSITGIMPYLRKSKMMGLLSDSFTLVATPDESIFAKITNDMLKQVVIDAKDKAKAEGKGFFGQWGSRMCASLNYAERYLDIHQMWYALKMLKISVSRMPAQFRSKPGKK